MITSDLFDRSLSAFPFLQRASRQALVDFQHSAFSASLPECKVVFHEGDPAGALALLLSGSVRVFKRGRTGREITLYRFARGDSCILTATAILNQQPFPANAVVEQAVEALLIPEETFRRWVQRHDAWREFTFRLVSLRLAEVLSLVDNLVFRRMDERTAAFLLQRSRSQHPIAITHQEIAAELGSSREVISRVLEGFAASGSIRAARNEIEILDFEALNLISSL